MNHYVPEEQDQLMQRQMVVVGGGERSARDRLGLLGSEGDQQFAQ